MLLWINDSPVEFSDLQGEIYLILIGSQDISKLVVHGVCVDIRAKRQEK